MPFNATRFSQRNTMSPAHITNLFVHVGAGTLALLIGFFLLATSKGTATHRRWGRTFAYLTLIVCLAAAVGTIFFRFIPLFAVLTLLVPYQLVSGWRSIYTKDRGPSMFDGMLTLIAFAFAVGLVPVLLSAASDKNVVVYSSLGALFGILTYDSLRWFFPRPWFQSIWRYDHIFKLTASLFAMLSALIGNVVRVGQPWSQIAPSAVGLLTICYFFFRLHRQRVEKESA